MNKVKMKPEQDWTLADRNQSPCEREAPSPLPTSETNCGRSCLQQNAKKCEIMNHDELGGLAKCSKENPVDNLTIKNISNQCCVHFASCRVNCEMETELFPNTIACPTKLDKLSPHQFAQAFKAVGEKNPDILLCEEVQRDCNNLKDWPAAALKGIRQLKKKGVWTECSKLEAKGE